MSFREISPYEMQGNVFTSIDKDWMLVGAQKEGKVNMMTASWGGMGILWNKPVAYIFIRPQRYTKEFMDSTDTFSLTFFDKAYRDQMTLCGTKSGRDIDKVEACGFQVISELDAPVFTQANTALICKKLYRQTLDPSCFIAQELDGANYPGKDYHDFYIAEICKVLVKS